MKTLYLECSMGAAGDMLTAAVYELLDDRQAFLDQMNALNLPGIHVHAEPSVKCGIHGTHMTVLVHGHEEEDHDHHHEHDHDHHHEHDHDHHHEHSSYASICALIESLNLPESVRRQAMEAYRLIGEAESRAHGAPIEQIHFHEVGSLDAVADVVGFFLALHLLGADRVVVSPVRVGRGMVRCAHGILPVPAPATADILRGVPCYAGEIDGEMCTPTGAALLRTCASSFESLPVFTAEKIGYGMGKRDFPAANCVRAFLGETGCTDGETDEIAELCCNLDDMSPEALGFAEELLRDASALDVFTTPIQMKKSRAGTLLTVLCAADDEEKFSRLLLLHTSTRGVRQHLCRRRKLSSRFETVKTAYGPIRIKCSEGWGAFRIKPEYDDVAEAARLSGASFDEVSRAACAAFEQEGTEK